MTTCFGKALKFWLGAAGSLALSISVACAEDKVIELKLSDWVPASHPLNKSLEEWGASVEKASNGTIKYKMYPAQQLGKAFDHYDMARDGIADLTFVSPGYQPGRFPIIGAGDLPFMIRDAKGAARAFAEWYPKYAATEMKDVKLCFAFAQEPGTFHSRDKKIVVPEDLKGMKIRPGHATMARLVASLGGTNVQAAAPEVRDVLEKGVVDGVNFPWNSVVLFGIGSRLLTSAHFTLPTVQIIIGTMALVAAAWLATTAGRPRTPPEWLNRLLGGQSLWVAGTAGLGIALPSVDYLAALAVIAAGTSTPATRMTALLAFNVVAFALVEIPLLAYLVAPERTLAAMTGLHRWIRARQRREVAGLLAVVGAVLVTAGLLGV